MIEDLPPLTSERNLPSEFQFERGQFKDNAGFVGTRQAYGERTPSGPAPKMPFWVDVTDGDTVGTYVATVNRGVVIETITNAGVAIIQHEVPDLVSITEDDGVTRFPILEGGKVYLAVWINEFGEIDAEVNPAEGGDACEILIWAPGEDALESVHYAPPINGDPGSTGVSYYLLAEFSVLEDGSIYVEQWAEGSNITHYHDLPIFNAPGSDGVDIFTSYNLAAGEYQYKLIRAKTEGTPPTGHQVIQLHVNVVNQSEENTTPVIEISADNIDIPSSITDTVTLVEGATLDETTGQERPQITVTERATTGPEETAGYSKAFTVAGTGADGSLVIRDCQGNLLFNLSWRDGMIQNNAAADSSNLDTLLYLKDCDSDSSWSTPAPP